MPPLLPGNGGNGITMKTKAKTSVAGCGDVVLKLNVNGEPKSCKLKDVLHVPDFGYSVLSVSKVTQNGLKVLFQGDKCAFKHNSKNCCHCQIG